MLPDISQQDGLDIAFGDAYNTKLIAQRCKSLVAIDISNRFLELAEAEKNPKNIMFLQADATNIPFKNEMFDFVVSTMSFMDMPNIEKVISEVYRVLNPNGFLQFSILHPCFNTYKGNWIKDEHGNRVAIQMKNYFEEENGLIQTWKHSRMAPDQKQFTVARFHKPIHQWINLLIEKGFQIEKLIEPFASDKAIEKYPELASTRIVAHTLTIRARKV